MDSSANFYVTKGLLQGDTLTTSTVPIIIELDYVLQK